MGRGQLIGKRIWVKLREVGIQLSRQVGIYRVFKAWGWDDQLYFSR